MAIQRNALTRRFRFAMSGCGSPGKKARKKGWRVRKTYAECPRCLQVQQIRSGEAVIVSVEELHAIKPQCAMDGLEVVSIHNPGEENLEGYFLVGLPDAPGIVDAQRESDSGSDRGSDDGSD